MDALRLRNCMTALMAVSGVVAISSTAVAATWQTRNFSVTAEREATAKKVGQQAEEYRRQLAIFWLGEPLPNWSKPCKLRVREGALGAGGQTTFQFARGEVLNWDMYVQGSLERILDSVLPHEINHTIFACHFRKPLPRWADEGAATLFEDRSEQLKQLALLNDVINNDRERITLKKLLSMKEYPEGMRPMLILYAQGYALADFLVQQKGRKAYLLFLADGDKLGWEEAIRKHFDHEGVDALERHWQGWVLAGMPKLTTPRDQMLTSISDSQQSDRSTSESSVNQSANQKNSQTFLTSSRSRPSRVPAGMTVRSQSPDMQPGGNTNIAMSLRDANPMMPSRGATTKSSLTRPAVTTNSVRESTALVSVNTSQQLGKQKWDIPRRATIQAPAPQFRVASPGKATQHLALFEGTISGNPTASDKPQNRSAVTAGTVAESLPANSVDMEQASFEAYLDEMFSNSPSLQNQGRGQRGDRPQNLEPTAAPINDASMDNSGSAFGPESHFESVHLPRERNVVSGSTPVWAGFPGQKKLF